MVDVMVGSLSKGQIVCLGELGSLLWVSIGSKGKETAEEVKVLSVKSSKVIFMPGKQIKNMLSTLEYQKM